VWSGRAEVAAGRGPRHRQEWLTCVDEAWGPPVRVAGGRQPGKGSEEGARAAPYAGLVVAVGFFLSRLELAAAGCCVRALPRKRRVCCA